MNKKTIITVALVFIFGLGMALYFQFGDFSSSGSMQPDSLDVADSEESTPPLIAVLIMILIPAGVVFFAFRGLFKFFISGKERKRILAVGRPAKAKILSLGESGKGVVTVNNQPFVSLKLEVFDGNKPPYQVEIKTIISRLDIPRFQPGTVLGVKIDPQNPQNVAIDPAGEGLGQESGVPKFGGEKWTDEDRKLLESKGIKGEAKIISVEDTGESKDFNPVAKLTYEVHIKDKSPYKLTKKITIPTGKVQMIKTFVGKNVPVKVHPNDSSKVELLFNPNS